MGMAGVDIPGGHEAMTSDTTDACKEDPQRVSEGTAAKAGNGRWPREAGKDTGRRRGKHSCCI